MTGMTGWGYYPPYRELKLKILRLLSRAINTETRHTRHKLNRAIRTTGYPMTGYDGYDGQRFAETQDCCAIGDFDLNSKGLDVR